MCTIKLCNCSYNCIFNDKKLVYTRACLKKFYDEVKFNVEVGHEVVEDGVRVQGHQHIQLQRAGHRGGRRDNERSGCHRSQGNFVRGFALCKGALKFIQTCKIKGFCTNFLNFTVIPA